MPMTDSIALAAISTDEGKSLLTVNASNSEVHSEAGNKVWEENVAAFLN